MAEALANGPMGESFKANIMKIKNMEKGYMCGQTDESSKDFGKMENNMVEGCI